jgi:ribosome maturation factor RimP
MRARRRSREGPPLFTFRDLKTDVRASNPLEEKIIALIEPAAADLGYAIVRVRLSGLKRKRLQIMAERIRDGQMGIDDCTKLSRALSPVLEASDPIKGEYDLEMSSPGIDRPLVRLEDFARFAGHEAKIELAVGIDGQRKFRGDIVAVEGGDIRLKHEHGEARFPFAHVANARLMLTDRLIAEDLRRARAAEVEDATNDAAGPADDAPARGGPGRFKRKPQ